MSTKTSENIDAYIAKFPEGVREKLQRIRTTVRKAAPNAEETISYGIPAFTFKGGLVYFAAFKQHIGFYPRTTALRKFEKELSRYECSKGTVKFPLDKPIPYSLITRIVKFRVKENREMAARKKKR